MKSYDRVTILRNVFRARDLRLFRERVQDYFDQLEHEEDTRATRAEINRMLPRILEIVQAADLAGPAPRAVETLHHIFSDRYSPGAPEEILDVIDMAVGVYDANRFAALARTVNPLHYVGAILGFVAGLPRRALVAFGLLRPRSAKASPDATADLIESRFAEMREWQSGRFAENADQLTDMAERIDFLERVLAQQPPRPQLRAGDKQKVTPQ
jgi:hypothetical protein